MGGHTAAVTCVRILPREEEIQGLDDSKDCGNPSTSASKIAIVTGAKSMTLSPTRSGCYSQFSPLATRDQWCP